MLTGQTRYRLGWRKKMVLQVSEWASNAHPARVPSAWAYVPAWRDATFEDVLAIATGDIQKEAPPFLHPFGRR